MRSACKSDRGLLRENNEDFVLADQDHGIFLLADGMGGGPAGEVASELAVTTAHALLLRFLADTRPGQVARLLAEALAAAHSAVAKRALGDLSLQGMGTTLEIVALRGAEAVICHVGDSRIYLFRQGELRQVTSDDNYAAVMVQNRMITADRIPSRYRHILTQAVGVSDELVPEIRSLDLKPGDLLLICSDGLNGALEDREIAALIKQKGQDLEALADALVRRANEKGGADNVSVVLVEPVAPVAGGTLPVLAA